MPKRARAEYMRSYRLRRKLAAVEGPDADWRRMHPTAALVEAGARPGRSPAGLDFFWFAVIAGLGSFSPAVRTAGRVFGARSAPYASLRASCSLPGSVNR